MALKKRVASAFGVDGDYWRIIGVENWLGGPNQIWPDPEAKPVTYIYVALYASKEARDAGKMPLETRKIVLDGEQVAPVLGAPKRGAPLAEATRENAYAALKLLKEFEAAEDDLAPSVRVRTPISEK